MSKRKNVEISENDIENQNKNMNIIKGMIGDNDLFYHIITYGCQMNVHDSEKLAGMLEYMGYKYTDSQNDADLILFNTCCVRDHAEQRVYGNVGVLKPLKQENPNLIIGVCGCMMQQENVSKDIARRFPFVDLIFGTHNLHHFPKLLLEAIDSKNTIIEVIDEDGRVVEDIPIERSPGISAWVTIMYGCNNYCSYCIVPYVRGRERSREPNDIIGEISQLIEKGYKEITLLGQNVNSYGKDKDENYLFPDLLRTINRIDGLERIRFMTSHPKDLSDDLISVIAECDKVCEHLHLPIQSGSDNILKEMNRKYSTNDYLTLVKKIREIVPDIALTTDIIVGYPGETDEDFNDTLEVMKQVKYDSAFTFMYSKRKGTPAAKKENQIDNRIKKERLNKLINLQTDIGKENNSKYLGKVVEVLVEGPSKNNPEMLSGRTRSNKLVNFSGGSNMIGSLVNVKITSTKSWTLEGIIDV